MYLSEKHFYALYCSLGYGFYIAVLLLVIFNCLVGRKYSFMYSRKVAFVFFLLMIASSNSFWIWSQIAFTNQCDIPHHQIVICAWIFVLTENAIVLSYLLRIKKVRDFFNSFKEKPRNR